MSYRLLSRIGRCGSSSKPTIMGDALKGCRCARAGAGIQPLRPIWRIENTLFTELRVVMYGSTVAIAYAIGLVWLLFDHRSFFGPHGTPCIDFTWMWVSGEIAGSSDPARVYNVSAFSTACKNLTDLGECLLVNSHF